MTACIDPSPLELFLSGDPLVPGEDTAAYAALCQHMLDDLRPEGALEVIWAQEIIDLTWQRRQYTQLRTHILARNRRSLLWSLLGGANLKQGTLASKRLSALLNRCEARDPDAVAHVTRALNEKGYDNAYVVVQAHRNALSELDPLEKLTAALERRRDRLLHDIERHQAFAARVRAVARQYERGAARCDDERLKRPPTEAEIARSLKAGRH
jgi:hypothetical protein